MPSIKTLYINLLFLLLATFTAAQDFPYHFQTWDTKSGLSSNFCNSVCSDNSGYIYVGTSNGLFFFNGYRFNRLLYAGNDNQIGEGNVNDILIDGYNRLWFASTENGLGLIHLNNLQLGIAYFRPDSSLLQSNSSPLQGALANKLCFDANGTLWVGTNGKGLYKFDTLNKKFTLMPFVNPASDYSTHIRSLTLYKPDSLLVGIVNGLSILNPGTGKVSHLNLKLATTNKTIRPSVRSIKHIKDSFLIATDRGSFKLAMATGELVPLVNNTKNKINFTKLASYDIQQLPDGELWIATENDGILFISASGEKSYFSWQYSIINNGVPKGVVNKFYKDKKNNIWIAHQNGISFLPSADFRFNSYSFEQGALYSGLMAADGNKLIFVRNNSITELEPAKNSTKTYTVNTKNQRKVLQGYALADKENYLLFFNDSFFTVNKTTHAVKQLPLNKHLVDAATFRHFVVMKSICDTIDGRQQYLLWVHSTMKSLLLTYDPVSGDLEYFSAGDFFKDPFENRYSNIVKAASGKYWISTLNQGLIYVDRANPANNKSFHINGEPGYKLPNNNVSDFILDKEGNIWALLFKTGLARLTIYTKDSSRLQIFDKENGLTDNRVYKLIEDDNKNIWLASGSGIFYFDTKAKLFLHYNHISNIPFNFSTVYLEKTSDGYIGITDNRFYEFLWFKPGNILLRYASLVINMVRVNDELVWLTPLQKNIFPAAKNSIVFNFEIIDYDKKSTYKILYQLAGYDKNWMVAGQTNSLQYRQLPGGNYTFRMKLKFADGTFSPEQQKSFTIKTIWYKTLLFKILLLLLVAALLYAMFRATIKRKLAKQKAAMELQQAVLLERNRISSELHDDLGGGLSTIKLMSEMNKAPGQEPGEYYLDAISLKSKELIQNMNEIVWSLNNDNDNLPGMLSYIRQYSKLFLDEMKIALSFHQLEIIPEMEVHGQARRHVFLLIKEALHNIVKHSQASEVEINVSMDADIFSISISDNGAGFSAAATAMGNGIKNMQQRTEILKGNMQIKNGKGTTIIFSFPFQSFANKAV